MTHLRRIAIGLALRLIGATVVSLIVWWLFTTPFDRIPLPRSAAIFAIVRILNFPVALAGELLYPIRGLELLFRDYDTWCDFCSTGEMFRQQMRLAVPVYVTLFYIPTVLRSIARRNARLFKRVVIGLLVYATFTAACFLMTSAGGRGAVRLAAIWFLILAAAAAFAWSPMDRRSKIGALAAVVLVGAWVFPFMMLDAAYLNYVSYLFFLTIGVSGTLSLTWAIEKGLDSIRNA
jgi:hypothetical protein